MFAATSLTRALILTHSWNRVHLYRAHHKRPISDLNSPRLTVNLLCLYFSRVLFIGYVLYRFQFVEAAS